MDTKKLQEIADAISQSVALVADVLVPVVETVRSLGSTLRVLGKSEEEIRAVIGERLAVLEAAITEMKAQPWGRHSGDRA
jgi:hypothetical protein